MSELLRGIISDCSYDGIIAGHNSTCNNFTYDIIIAGHNSTGNNSMDGIILRRIIIRVCIV